MYLEWWQIILVGVISIIAYKAIHEYLDGPSDDS